MIRSLRRGRPIWLRKTADLRPSYPRLTGRQRVDVAIVGGGLTGALIARAFADAGVHVTLVEASRVGRGSTAASSALLLHELDMGMSRLRELYGFARSARIWHLSVDAVHELAATLRRLDIECNLARSDAIYYARTADAAGPLRAELALRKRAGLSGEWLTPPAVRRATGIVAHGAIRTIGNAQCDPYKACVGVMQAASAAGAAVYERSRVTRIDRLRRGVRLHTRTGTIEAARVVVATGYATAEFRPLAGRFRLFRTYVLATRPLTPSERRALGLHGVMIWDSRHPYHYARWTADHRLLVGGEDVRVRSGRRRDLQFREATRRLREEFVGLFPPLHDVAFERAWEGLFAMTPDTLPYIGPHQRYPGHWFALGYGGNGMTFSQLAARLLLEQWRGRVTRDHELFSFGRFR